MEPKVFVNSLKERVVENDLTQYKNMLEDSKSSNDIFWKSILPLYKMLNRKQKDDFLAFVRVIQVNAVSHVLGILDGSTFLNEENASFKLMTESSDDIINGELQDIFLELEENENH